MAIITQYAKCALCGELLAGGEIVATTHFIAAPHDPLWRFSDAAMHHECFQQWPHREEFVNKYNSTVGQHVWGNETQSLMHPDGTVETVPARRS